MSGGRGLAGLAVVLTLCLFASAGFAGDSSKWRFPAEFEKQEAMYLGWLSKEYFKGYKTDDVLLRIVKARPAAGTK